MNRRHFLASIGSVSAAAMHPRAFAATSVLNVALIGTGMRGQVLLKELLKRDDVNVAALCDIEPIMLTRALAMIDKAGKRKPATFGDNADPRAYQKLLRLKGLDAVIIATPWEWRAPMAIDAMEAKIAVGCEVVAGITLEDHWNVLRAHERTRTPYMLLENVCYRRDVMAVLRMVREGVFGELIHMQGGYQHDLRGVKFNSGKPDEPYDSGAEFGAKGWSEARWRTQHSVTRNGELYPSHGICPCAVMANIHRGNRFTAINAFSTKARGLSEYVAKKGGRDHPNTSVKFALGDVVTTTLACENGETILLQHDTSLPRPYSLGFRVQGTRGLWMDVNRSIHVEGKSPAHKWDDAKQWLTEYDHPLWKRYEAKAAGAGHGGMDFFVVHAFIEAVKRKAPMPIDIYDAVAWSAITPLSEQSIAEGFKTLPFPDFTRGGWKTRKPIFGFDDQY